MRKTETRTIDDVTFEVTQLGFAEGSKVFARVAKKAGGALAKLADGSPEALAAAVTDALEKFDESDLDWLAETFGRTTRYSGGDGRMPYLHKDKREDLFAGRLLLFFQWVLFALEVNFSDFSAAFRAPSGRALGGQTPAPSPDSTNS